MGSGCCKRKKKVEDGEADPPTASDPKSDPDQEDQPKFILVKTNDNSEILPLKKRYRYEIEDLEDILNGTTTLVKTPIKNNPAQGNGVHQNGVSKTTTLTRVVSQDSGIHTPYKTPYRSRSYSPRKDNFILEKKRSPRKRSESNNNGDVKSKNLKNSVSFEDNNVYVVKNGTGKNASREKGDILEKSIKNLEHQISVQNNSDKNSTKSTRNKNESLINNPETNPMNPLDKDLNILETIKYYLDSVKQNNYNESHSALQVKSPGFVFFTPYFLLPKYTFCITFYNVC